MTLQGFVNCDFFQFEFIRNLIGKKSVELEWEADLRHPLVCDSDAFQGILMEHTLEHLKIQDAVNLLGELFRILKPEGTLRISVPDLEKYVAFYNGELPHKKFYNWHEHPGEAFWSLCYNYGHQSVYDFSVLQLLLTEIGFSNIGRSSFNNSRDENLRRDSKGREWESLYVEATKPAQKT